MKQDTKKTGQFTEQAIENVNSAIDLSQKTAGVVLDSAVETAKAAGNYYYDAVKVGLSVQETGVGIARNYFEGMAKINQSWINLFAGVGERTIKSVGENVKQPISDMITAGADVVENAAAQAKQATK